MNVTSTRNKRYSAHAGLAEIGEHGQERISRSRVGLVGLGGLGCAVAQYLVSSGVGTLTLFDFDTVSESNLARQFLYRPGDVGRLKIDAAAERLAADNPQVSIEKHATRADRAILEARAPDLDLIVDASDNFGTRLAVNRACLEAGLPWVMGACIRMEGQVILFKPGSACYRCIYRDAAGRLEDCPGAGIFSTVAGMIGTFMAHLALAQLAGLEPETSLQVFDGKNNQWKRLGMAADPDCPDCAGLQAG